MTREERRALERQVRLICRQQFTDRDQDLPVAILDAVLGTADWQGIAADLAGALDSFMAYDGYGPGGADDGNRGDWPRAESAMERYQQAAR